MKALIRLFKAVKISKKMNDRKVINRSILEKTIKNGFIFAPEVIRAFSEKELLQLVELVEEEIGITAEKMNSSFHKSWKKVKEADIEQLVLEQIIHYFTTYGFEKLGIYSEESIYIPNEKLEIPGIDIDEIKLTIIKGYTSDEIEMKIMTLLESGIALHEDTVKNVIEVFKSETMDKRNIGKIKNREVKTALFDYFGMVPKDPVDFLRYVIFKTTEQTLLIKNPAMIEKIEDGLNPISWFKIYRDIYGLHTLSEIFFRFKPLFLAFKSKTSMPPIINKIRKLADKYHKPMKADYLNSITAMIKRNEHINYAKLHAYLSEANVFRKIRLAYALKYRTKKDTNSILYTIRNGKGYATEFNFERQNEARKILNIVLSSIVSDIIPNVEDKKIYIPAYIKYTVPATEKQFVGNFPFGTCISVPKDMIFGVHWNNVRENRIDLDLSLMNMEVGKIGWDGGYRTEDRTILFSGDMTDAKGKNGASELFYVKKQRKQEFMMFINYFNYNSEIEVPFNIIIAKEYVTDLNKNYMINPNNIVLSVKTKMDRKQKALGLLITTVEECRFYFSEVALGGLISARNTKSYVDHAKKYLSTFYQNTISLNSLLQTAGAIIVEDPKDCDIDLSPETLEKDKILQLLYKN